jgi:transposase
MEMNAGYEREVAAHCPNTAIVFDLFRLVAKYGREVIDRVRIDRASELRADPGRLQSLTSRRRTAMKRAQLLVSTRA